MRISDWSSDVCSSDLILAAKSSMGAELERFAENTLRYIQAEGHLLVDEPDVPEVPGVDFRGRHVLIVVRGLGYKDDLQLLRRSGYIADQKPVLIAVDGGADALLAMGRKPDVIIGDMDRSEEHTSELQSLMRISYAVFCLKKKNTSE